MRWTRWQGSWVALCIGAAACGGGSASDFAGSWRGTIRREETVHVPGTNSSHVTTTRDLFDQVWNVVDCGDGLGVEIYANCPVRAGGSGAGRAFTAGSWCEATNTDGSKLRALARGGALTLVPSTSGEKPTLAGRLELLIHRTPSSGVYTEYVDVLSGTMNLGPVEKGTRCSARSAAPPAEDDFSAEAGCTTIVDRAADGADRTVDVAAGALQPRCMRIAPGQTVTFPPKSSTVDRGLPGNPNAGSEGNPIGINQLEQPLPVLFEHPGDFLFRTNAAPVLVGLIRVR